MISSIITINYIIVSSDCKIIILVTIAHICAWSWCYEIIVQSLKTKDITSPEMEKKTFYVCVPMQLPFSLYFDFQLYRLSMRASWIKLGKQSHVFFISKVPVISNHDRERLWKIKRTYSPSRGWWFSESDGC